MTKDQESRLRLLAQSNVVSGDIRAALEEIDMLRFLTRPHKESPEECTLVAVHTGDAWQLAVEDRDEDEVAVLAWPKSWPDTMTADQLKAYGFVVV